MNLFHRPIDTPPYSQNFLSLREIRQNEEKMKRQSYAPSQTPKINNPNLWTPWGRYRHGCDPPICRGHEKPVFRPAHPAKIFVSSSNADYRLPLSSLSNLEHPLGLMYVNRPFFATSAVLVHLRFVNTMEGEPHVGPIMACPSNRSVTEEPATEFKPRPKTSWQQAKEGITPCHTDVT